MRLDAAIEGSLERHMRSEMRAAERAVVSGIGRATDGLKREMRAQVAAAGLGRRLANSWRGRLYENRKLDAAGLVHTRAPMIMRAHDEGAVIRGRNGRFLALPTAGAPRRGVGGRRISPATFPVQRFGPLRFVDRGAGRPPLLVVDHVRIGARTGRVGRRAKGGGYTRRGRLKTGMTTVVMFVLVPQVRLRKRLDFEHAAARWQARLPDLVIAGWKDPAR